MLDQSTVPSANLTVFPRIVLADAKASCPPMEAIIKMQKIDMKIIIELIKENPTVTISEMAKVINKSTRTVQRIINASKCITRVGSKYNGYWKVSE